MAAGSPTPVTDREATIHRRDFRPQRQCKHCGTAINWMHTRTGGRMPFNAELLTRDLDPDQAGWIPGLWVVAGKIRMVMAPLLHYGADRAARAHQVAIVHRCPEYDRACTVGIVA